MENLKETMKDVLENNILNYWIHKVKDEENGGFYGRVDLSLIHIYSQSQFALADVDDSLAQVHLLRDDWHIVAAHHIFCGSQEAVSYAHLDVYKRQALMNATTASRSSLVAL